MSRVPYLAYLKNLREAPDKRSAMQGSPTKGLGGKKRGGASAKADLAVYQDSRNEIVAQLIEDIKMPEETKMRVFESQRSNRALTTEDGTPITLDEANASMEESEEKPTPPEGGLMSPESESEESGNYEEDPILDSYSTEISNLKSNNKFMDKLSEMLEKYPGTTEREFLVALARESSMGKNMGRLGNAFQIQEKVEVGGEFVPNEKAQGIDFEALKNSTDLADHLEAFDTYLSNWGYDGSATIGLMLAAPGFRNASPDTVVYEKGSSKLIANPGWAGPDGNATVASITEFYRG